MAMKLSTELTERTHQEDLQRIRGFRLMDEDFLAVCLDCNSDCTELVLRIVLGMPDLRVTAVYTGGTTASLLDRSVVLDILATDSKGRRFGVKIQREYQSSGRKYARFNLGMMDADQMKTEADFHALTENYVIIITEHDPMGYGLPLYHVERTVLQTGERFDDGAHILYVNGEYRGDDPLGKLMHDFSCTNPNDMNFGVLADRVRFFKESKEGVAVMCKVIEDMRLQERKEGREEGCAEVIRLLQAIAAGQTDEEIQMDNTYADFDLIKKIRTALSGATD